MTEEQKQINVGDMLRLTGANTAEFMKQVADHIDQLNARIVELEGKLNGDNSQAQ
jgi:hypothetical protein